MNIIKTVPVLFLFAAQSVKAQTYSVDYTYPRTKHSLIRQDRKLGMIDSNNRLISPPLYDKLIDFNDGLARVEQNDKVGFVDEQGKLVIPCMYEPDTLYITGNQTWHVMHADGGESIKIGATPERIGFTEGLACVIQNGKYGFINKENKTVIPFQYDGADNFLDSIAIVKQNDKYGAIDKTGKIIIPLIYDLLVWEGPNSWEPLLYSKKDGECFLMDKNQKRIRGCFE